MVTYVEKVLGRFSFFDVLVYGSLDSSAGILKDILKGIHKGIHAEIS